jgi:hypothetical protein
VTRGRRRMLEDAAVRLAQAIGAERVEWPVPALARDTGTPVPVRRGLGATRGRVSKSL